MRKIALAVAAVTAAVTAGLAAPAFAGDVDPNKVGCPPNGPGTAWSAFQLVGIFGGEYQEVGALRDLNGDGWVCVATVNETRGIRLWIDNSLPYTYEG